MQEGERKEEKWPFQLKSITVIYTNDMSMEFVYTQHTGGLHVMEIVIYI